MPYLTVIDIDVHAECCEEVEDRIRAVAKRERERLNESPCERAELGRGAVVVCVCVVGSVAVLGYSKLRVCVRCARWTFMGWLRVIG